MFDDSPSEASDEFDAPAESQRPAAFRLTIRSALAATAGLAFVALCIRWFIDMGVPPAMLATLLVPWACGTFLGIAVMRRRGWSTLLGGIVGGALGVLVWAIGLGIFGRTPHGEDVLILLALGVCGSGIVAGLVGVVADGVTWRRR